MTTISLDQVRQTRRDAYERDPALRLALAALVVAGAEQDVDACRERMRDAVRRLRAEGAEDRTKAAAGALRLACRRCGACEGLG